MFFIFHGFYNDYAQILKNKHVCKNTTLNRGKFLPAFYAVIFNKFFYECNTSFSNVRSRYKSREEMKNINHALVGFEPTTFNAIQFRSQHRNQFMQNNT